MKKSLKIIIILIVLAIIVTIIVCLCKRSKIKVVSAYDEIYEIQKEVDKELEKYIDNKNYTFDNPKVILNPYKISPLTALVIFQTEEEQSVEVKVNGTVMTTVESSTKHAIPIYGMYADYENKVELKLEDGEVKELSVKTDKYEGDPITLEETSSEIENNLYFVSPNFVNNCIINGKGEVLWYVLGDYAGDIEYLENGHFYISDPNQGKNGVKINYSSFVEMDYLGKIYKQYIVEYGLHHELVPLSNNKMMVLGTSDESDFVDAEICIVDLETGKTIKHLDLYKFLHDIDPKLIESLKTRFDLVNNSADYNEETGELLISLRGVNSLMKLDFNTNEIKWIFGDPEFWGNKFSKYMLKVKDNTRFLGGQHSAFYTENGLISVHNNDIDQFDLSNSNLSHYLDRYTSCDIYKIDEKNMTIETKWQYTADKEQFSNVAGHIDFQKNGNKVITYGWAMTKEAYKNPEEILYTDPAYKNGVIMEINNKEEVLFKVTMPGLIYRTFKIDSFYNSETIQNYKVEEFTRINGTENNGHAVETSSISKELKSAEKYTNKIEVITNRVSISDELSIEDSAEVIFVGQDNLSYVYSYKESGKEGPKSFNSGFATKKMNVPEGIYEVYIKINDTYYNTNLNINF